MSVLVQIARGLSHIHHTGVVHLDVKPENIIACASTDVATMFRLADFGQSKRRATDVRVKGGSIAANMVNTSVYRPLHLFYTGGGEVSVRYSFDLWAFGCVVFDVLQQHPRWRSADGRVRRLFSGVKMDHDYNGVLRLRNYRLVQMLARDVVARVVRFQPDGRKYRGADRLLCTDLVQSVVHLLP